MAITAEGEIVKIGSTYSTLGPAVAIIAALLSANAPAQNLVVTPAMPTGGAPFTLDFDVDLSGCSYLHPPTVMVDGHTINMLLGTNCIVSSQHAPVHFSAPIPGVAEGIYNATWQIEYEPLSNLSQPVSIGQITVGAAVPLTVIEYYNADMDHYFMTSLPNEIALCDVAQPPCAGWARTGKSFKVWPPGTVGQPGGNAADTKICRLFNDSFAGTSTHFYATPDVCAQALALFPDWQLETNELFDANMTDANGHCLQASSSPVHRLYNNGMGGAPNHRFTTDNAVVQQMIAMGWTPEGIGDPPAVFCVPNGP